MVWYMYMKEYCTDDLELAFEHHLANYVIADKYQCRGLQEAFAHQFGHDGFQYFDHQAFADIVPHIYELPPFSRRLLRDAVVTISTQHIRELMTHDRFKEMMNGEGEFARDIIEAMLLHTECETQNGPASETVREHVLDFS